jgi:hypothetical protein
MPSDLDGQVRAEVSFRNHGFVGRNSHTNDDKEWHHGPSNFNRGGLVKPICTQPICGASRWNKTSHQTAKKITKQIASI